MGQKKIVTKTDSDIKPMEAVVSTSKKSTKKQVLNGIAHINISYNNTIIDISDLKGDIIAWSTSGLLGFKGARKSTPYAAGVVVRDLAEFVKNSGLIQVDVVIKGVGMGRESAIRALSGLGLQVLSIKDRTPVPHNGPRARRPRRV